MGRTAGSEIGSIDTLDIETFREIRGSTSRGSFDREIDDITASSSFGLATPYGPI